MTEEHLFHTIPPVYDKNSRILILGSFPSVKSRECEFFYGHPQNRFWRVLSKLLDSPLPVTVPEKKKLLTENGIALWDVIGECDITGSSDSSIKNVLPNDISLILSSCSIKAVFSNGSTSKKLYDKYIFPKTGVSSVMLHSTSPANAGYSFEKLLEEWSFIKEYL